jgi:long-chain acyl-CoA synthetase
VPEETVPFQVLRNAVEDPNRPAYFTKADGGWGMTTWGQYGSEVRRAARSLIALGIEPGDTVNILGWNRPEWVIFDVAAMAVGAVPAGIYTTNSPEEVAYIVNHSEAPIVLVEDEAQWHKIVHRREHLPGLRHVVTMKGAPAIDDPLVMTWEEFLAAGEEVGDEAVDARIEGLQLDALGTLIYTSGTTGPPKGVMLSHRNMAWTAKTAAALFSLNSTDSNLSYLPLSHIAEQMFTIHIPAMTRGSIYYAESIEKLADNLKETRPTIFAGVPRVWEKFYTGVSARVGEAHGIKAKLAAWAQKVGREVIAARNRGKTASPLVQAQYKLADKLVLSKVREALGLDRTRVFLTAAAPISVEILEFFSGFGMIVNEVYGQSEDSGPTSVTVPGRTNYHTVGPAFPGVEVKIADDGEILVKGPNVFMGYYKDPDATAETLVDGWLHSGDLGAFDADGNLMITGRKKDIIITAGGKNVAPKNMESGLKNHPLIAEAVVIGDRRKYLTVLVSLDVEAATQYLDEHDLEEDPHESKLVRDSIQLAIDELNTQFARVEQIKKFAVLPRPLSIEGGELTPTLKVKRNVVNDNFADEIEALYADG